MTPLDWAAARRILAVRLDNVGDVVMLGPALRAVRAAAPAARITLLASPAGSQVAPLLPEVDEVVVHRALWQDASGALAFDPAREAAFVAALRERAFDVALIFTSFSQTPHAAGYACYLAGIPVRVGESKEFGGRVLSHAAPPLPDEVHQVDRNAHLVEATGLPVTDRRLRLEIPPDAARAVEALRAELGLDAHRYVVVAPGASCAARRYPAERFGQVARDLASDLSMPVVVVGSEREAALVGSVVAAAGPGAVALAGRTSVPELAALVASAALVVCNNSGPLHLADAFARPLVVLYSGTDVETQWAPRSSPARILRRHTDCTPCYRFDCPIGLECLDVPADDVAAAACHLLATTTMGGRA